MEYRSESIGLEQGAIPERELHEGGNFIDRERIKLLESENQALVAENERLRKALETDSLTGLNNREGFANNIYKFLKDPVLPQQSEEKRQFKGSAVVFIDLNGMKKMNDDLGYEATNDVLVQFSSLASLLRSSDIACRYAGDEFVIFMPNTDATIACQVIAQKVKNILARKPIFVTDENGTERAVDVSFAVGAIQIPEQLPSFSDRSESDAWVSQQINKASILEKHAKRESGSASIVVAHEDENGEPTIIPEDQLLKRPSPGNGLEQAK